MAQTALPVQTLQRKTSISYGGTIAAFFTIPPADQATCSWSITHDGQLIQTGTGTTLGAYVFDKPGNYQATLQIRHLPHTGRCNHNDIDQRIDITVGDVQAMIEYEEAFWQRLFSQQKTFASTDVTVPVTLRFYGQPHAVNDLKLGLVGVGCDMIGTLKTPTAAQAGTQRLTFTLSGQIGKGVYAMLDFADHNGRITTFSLKQPLD